MSATTNLNSVLTVGLLVKLRLRLSATLQNSGLAVDDRDRAYDSRIENISNDVLVVDWPTDQGILVPITVGQDIKVEIRKEGGQYALASKIVAKSQHRLPVLHIASSGSWSTAQMRNNVRLKVSIVPIETLLISSQAVGSESTAAVRATALRNARQTKPGGGMPIRATIQDISASGMRIVAAVHLALYDTLLITFPLGKGQPDISTKARVVRIQEGEGSAKGHRTEAGCEFVDLPLKDQDAIMRFIFAKQAELRRSGLL